uniref:Small ribosomal subunit protein mS26 n=1 Tax=Lynx canadensis TaxID=61383 RepID=A0A667G2F8_LYNCA
MLEVLYVLKNLRALLLLPVRGCKTCQDTSKVGGVATPPEVGSVELFMQTENYRQYRQSMRALRLEFVSKVWKKVHEAWAGNLAEGKVLQDAADYSNLLAWNRAENQQLHELWLGGLRQEAEVREQEQWQVEEKAPWAERRRPGSSQRIREVRQLQKEAKHFIT